MAAPRTPPLVMAVGVAVMAFSARSRPAHAEPEAAPFRLDYEVAADCPDEQAFVRDVRRRTARLEDAGAQTWTVRAVRDGDDAFRGRLTVRDAEGREATRDVLGATCREVVYALALVGALTVDPGAAARPAATFEEAPPPAPPPSEGASPAAPPPEASARPWELGAGARSGAEVGSGPGLAATLGGLVELRARRAAWWSPAVRAGFERSLAARTAQAGDSSAAFALTLATLDLCPSRGRAGAFSASGCLRGELGALEAEGQHITLPRTQAPLWVAAAAFGRGEVAFAGPVFFAVSLGLRVPLVRTRFFFRPDTTVYRPPPVGGIASIELGLHFP